LNGTRISAAHDLVNPCLRLKEAMKACCTRFYALYFLMEEKWKYAAEIEDVPHNTSRLTSIFQNEEKLNAECVPVARKITHDGLSS
jgi:hypothetical protein